MQELHILIEGHLSCFLNRISQLQMVTLLKQNRRVVDKHSIKNGHNSHIVLDDSRLYLVGDVVVDGVLHVGG